MPCVRPTLRTSLRVLGPVLCLLLSACSTGDRPASAPPHIGISYGDELVWMSDGERDDALDDAVTLGATWIRADLSWADIQPEGPGSHLWERFDRVVHAARQRGLQILPVLAYTPPWARPGGCSSEKCEPSDPAQFVDFAEAAARRYAPEGLHTWEVWNEPNGAGGWLPRPDAAAYTVVLEGVAGAVRRVDPQAVVILGGLAALSDGDGGVPETEFLEQVCEHGGIWAVDAVAYHPYTYPYLASDRTSWGTSWNRMADTPTSLRNVLSRCATPDLQIWITEYGAPTDGPGAVSDGTTGAGSAATTHVTEDRQAVIAADAVHTAAATPFVAGLFWYSLRDLSEDPASAESFFGLRRHDGSAKPAFAAFREAVSRARRYPDG
jgi:hypothetical protein